ncbi:MAG: hypothetical protein HY667_05740 [Chloroflexi bacterium]|nr:hypothetical protein [Chloroflexota bacterium]
MIGDTAIENKVRVSGSAPAEKRRVGDRVFVLPMRVEGLIYKIEGEVIWCRIPVYPGLIGLTRPDCLVSARRGLRPTVPSLS